MATQSDSLLKYLHNNLDRDTLYTIESNGEVVELRLKEAPLEVFNYFDAHSYCVYCSNSTIDLSQNKVTDCVFVFNIREEIFYEEGII